MKIPVIFTLYYLMVCEVLLVFLILVCFQNSFTYSLTNIVPDVIEFLRDFTILMREFMDCVCVYWFISFCVLDVSSPYKALLHVQH